MTVNEYVSLVKQGLPRHFAPGGVYHGEEGALKLAREVGRGLADFPEEDVKKVLGTLYSDLLVRFTFGNVPIDAKPWVEEIERGMRWLR